MSESVLYPGDLSDPKAVLEDARLRQRRRRRGMGAIAVLVAAGIGIAVSTMSSPGASRPSHAFAVASNTNRLVSPVTAQLLSGVVALPYVPAGLELQQDSRYNSPAGPYTYQDTIQYGSASRRLDAPTARLTITVLQSSATTFARADELSCSPASSCPPFHLTIDGVEATGNGARFASGFGPTTIYWSPNSHTHLAVQASGLSRSVVVRVADSLVFHPQMSCITGDTARHDGLCGPNTYFSSPADVLPPSQMNLVGRGAIDTKPWRLFAQVSADKRSFWSEVTFANEVATLNDDPPTTDSEETTVIDGHKFLIGLVPQAVTRARIGGAGDATSVTVASVAVDGWKSFAAPMPASVLAACDALRPRTVLTPKPHPVFPTKGRALLQAQSATEVSMYAGSHLLPTKLSACNTYVSFTALPK
jgi:hypothetical protein